MTTINVDDSNDDDDDDDAVLIVVPKTYVEAACSTEKWRYFV